MAKTDQLLKLAKNRQSSRWVGYRGIGDYHQGRYECNFVSPYTKSAGNVDARIMVLLQDWSSNEWLSGPFHSDVAELGRSPNLPTNINLCHLLRETFSTELASIYATNLFPFIKSGGMSSTIAHADLVRAAREFAIPQIIIVAPRVVICLGLITFNALREAQGQSKVKKVGDAIDSPFDIGVSRIWCQAHTGALGQLNRKRLNPNQVIKDWLRMKDEVRGVA